MLAEKTQVAWKEKWLWIGICMLVALLAVAIISRTAGAPRSPEPAPRTAQIVSPWAGEFCAGEYLGGPPYVEVGSVVGPSTIVGRIETVVSGDSADKGVESQWLLVTAGMSGTIVQVLVADRQMVVPGDPLFKVQLAEPAPSGK